MKKICIYRLVGRRISPIWKLMTKVLINYAEYKVRLFVWVWSSVKTSSLQQVGTPNKSERARIPYISK